MRITAAAVRLRAVVSGSAVGIGRGICQRVVAEGGVVLGLDIDGAANEACGSALGPAMTATYCDVGDARGVREAVTAWVAAHGAIDLVVNNAAIWNDTRLTADDYDTQTTAFRRAIDACLLGSFHCAAASVSAMGPGSNIINLITNHIRPNRLITGAPATGYDAAKFGQWRLTESWAVELAPRGVRVNGLAFGATDTPMLRSVSPRMADNGMLVEDVVQAVWNIVSLGTHGPTGRVYDIGDNGTPRTQSLAEIEAILDDRS
jgi:NAD(P)-dependent dehydrogenase (short-subunit alcohol dehydrogenase family)